MIRKIRIMGIALVVLGLSTFGIVSAADAHGCMNGLCLTGNLSNQCHGGHPVQHLQYWGKQFQVDLRPTGWYSTYVYYPYNGNQAAVHSHRIWCSNKAYGKWRPSR